MIQTACAPAPRLAPPPPPAATLVRVSGILLAARPIARAAQPSAVLVALGRPAPAAHATGTELIVRLTDGRLVTLAAAPAALRPGHPVILLLGPAGATVVTE